MDKNQFWQLIERCKEKAGVDLDLLYEQLLNELKQLSVAEIMTWQQIFDEYQRLSYKDKLWAAAYTINGGCSDDSFDYFRAWLTAQGKDVFMKALADPDSLADCQAAQEEVACFEEIMSACCMAYFRKLNMKNHDYDKFYQEVEKYSLSEETKAELAAEIIYDETINCQWDEADLPSVVPRLCETFDWE